MSIYSDAFDHAKGWSTSTSTNKYHDEVLYAERADAAGRIVVYKVNLTGKFAGSGSAWIKGCPACERFVRGKAGETFKDVLAGVWHKLQAKAGPVEPAATTVAMPAAVIPASFPTKKARTEWFRETLAVDAELAKRALAIVFANQTADEQEVEATVEENGVGFTGCDAEILTSFHKQITGKGYLSPKQMTLLFKKIRKYHAQVIAAVEAEGAALIVKATKEAA